MPITVRCASCGKALKAREESAGKKVKCPGCGAVISVPRPDGDEGKGVQAARPTASTMPPQTPPRRREEADDDERVASRKPMAPLTGRRPRPSDDEEEDDERPRKAGPAKKESAGQKALQAVLGVLILAAIGFGVWWFFLRGDGGDGWKEFTSTDGNFKVLLPGDPKHSTQGVAGRTLHLYTIEYPKTREKYVVTYLDHPEAERGVGADVIVENEVETIANMPGKRLKSKGIKRSWQVKPGMTAAQTTIDTQDQGTTRARAVMVKNRLFLIIVHSPSMDKYEEITQKIYDSFQIVGDIPAPAKDGAPKDEVKDADKKDDDRKDETKDDKKDSDKIAKTDTDKKDDKKEDTIKPATGPFRGHTGFIEGIALSRKGDRLATVGRDGTLRVWDYPSGKEILFAKVQEEYREPNSVAFHPTEDRLVVGLGGPLEKIVHFDLARKKETSRGPVDGSAQYIKFTPDGNHLIFVARQRVHRLDPNVADKGTLIVEAWPAILSSDGKTLFVNKGVEFWHIDVETKTIEKSPEGWPRWERGIRSWAISGDGSLLAYGHGDGGVYFADPGKKAHLPRDRKLKTGVVANILALSFKGDLLALRHDRGWQVYSLPDGKLVAGGKEEPRHLLFAPNGALIMTNRENLIIREGPKFQEKK